MGFDLSMNAVGGGGKKGPEITSTYVFQIQKGVYGVALREIIAIYRNHFKNGRERDLV